MLIELPYILQILVLGLLGLFVGAFINRSIYAWAMFQDRRISPWQRPHEKQSARIKTDYLPIYGWLGLRRDRELYGKSFWIRPMLIEVSMTLIFPVYFFWFQNGGLLVPPATATPALAEFWFWIHIVLLTLMTIGTFIDFDEKTIPDQVTVTGTIFGWLIAAHWPEFNLPETAPGLAGTAIAPVQYFTPFESGTLHLEPTGLWLALGIFVIWIYALWPKLPFLYVGIYNSIRLMYAHSFRPKRKTKCDIRIKPRKTPLVTIVLCVLFLLGMILIPLAWINLPALNWQSLVSSMIGTAFGGGMVWAVRIVGTLAMQQEAMGFGDVTLMGMIGAFVGWQATIIIFFFAALICLVVVLIQFTITRQNAIAFGPFICAGAMVVILYWGPLWEHIRPVFKLGIQLIYVMLGSLVLMALMLLGLAWLKGPYIEEAEVE